MNPIYVFLYGSLTGSCTILIAALFAHLVLQRRTLALGRKQGAEMVRKEAERRLAEIEQSGIHRFLARHFDPDSPGLPELVTAELQGGPGNGQIVSIPLIPEVTLAHRVSGATALYRRTPNRSPHAQALYQHIP